MNYEKRTKRVMNQQKGDLINPQRRHTNITPRPEAHTATLTCHASNSKCLIPPKVHNSTRGKQ